MIDPDKTKHIRIQLIFIALFFIIAIAMDLALSIYVFQWRSSLAIIYLALVQIINLGIAYELTEWIVAFLIKKRDLPKLPYLKRYPPVAVLYLTRNDLVPFIISRLKALTYPNLEIFILDDSTQAEYHQKIDNYGFRVSRRKSQMDFKAGNLNHWFWHHNEKFKYLIVLDNDSLIPENFVEEMVMYAEHSANNDVAIFQSSVGIWNEDNYFARTLDVIRPMRMFISERIDNPCESLLPTTNVLIRTFAIKAIGGFGTQSVTTEDWETGLKVISQGYRCQRVDVPSYVSVSTSARMHAHRMTRWASGILQIAKLNIKNIPLTTNLRLFMGIYSYTIWLVYLLGVLLAIWGFHSTWDDLLVLSRIVRYGYLWQSVFLYPLLLMLSYCLYFILIRPILAYRIGVSLPTYVHYVLLASAIGFYSFAPLLKEQVQILLGKRPKRETLAGGPTVITIRSLLKEMRLPIFVLGLIIIGLIRNPLAIILNFIWLIPLFLSPLVLYLWQRSITQPYSQEQL